MKISILNFDFSNNSLGRAYILAKILSKKYEVEILGPIYGSSIWEPLKNNHEIKYVVLSSSLRDIVKNLKKIDGDIIYAIKPYGTSYGFALLKKMVSNKPIILDEDDWDIAFHIDYPLFEVIINILQADLLNLNNLIYTFLLSNLTFLADSITVSSNFLQKKFGGVIIPHARDPRMYKTSKVQFERIKKKLNPDNKKIIMFYGTVRKHKGIDIIVKAIDGLKRKDIMLIIVGVDETGMQFIPLRDYIINLPPINFKRIPRLLQLADLVVLPQKKSFSSLGQVPAKLFDAMAMGIPIIASNISDNKIILNNCGLIFEPENIVDLRSKMEYLLNNPKEAKNLGRRAQEKFLKNYTFKAVEEDLFNVIETVKKRFLE